MDYSYFPSNEPYNFYNLPQKPVHPYTPQDDFSTNPIVSLLHRCFCLRANSSSHRILMPTPPPFTTSSQPFPSSKIRLFHIPFLSSPIRRQPPSIPPPCPHQCPTRFRPIWAWIWIRLIRVRAVGVVMRIKKLGRRHKAGEKHKIVLRESSALDDRCVFHSRLTKTRSQRAFRERKERHVKGTSSLPACARKCSFSP